LQLKDKGGHKKRSAYWRGERLWIFLKGGVFVVSLIILVTSIGLGIKASKKVFPIKNIVVSGNNHLEDAEIRKAISPLDREGLLMLSLKETERVLKTIPWVKRAYLRKQFPETLIIRIKEAVPKALLSLNGTLSLMDEEGRLLEEIKEERIPFLPVIKGNTDIMEALKLIDALSEKGVLQAKGFIEITSKPYGLSINMDGEVFKIGYGRYAEKLQQWKELEAEVKKRGIPIEYIDLRFADRVIVKPLKVTGR